MTIDRRSSTHALRGEVVTQDSLADLTISLRRFAEKRDWDKFHTPKNLACALITEAGELLEHFRWEDFSSETLTDQKRREIEEELADILIFLVRLADKLGTDLPAAAVRKLALNEERYPVEKSRGSSKKYTDI
jgi:dCTP diphosphatase